MTSCPMPPAAAYCLGFPPRLLTPPLPCRDSGPTVSPPEVPLSGDLSSCLP